MSCCGSNSNPEMIAPAQGEWIVTLSNGVTMAFFEQAQAEHVAAQYNAILTSPDGGIAMAPAVADEPTSEPTGDDGAPPSTPFPGDTPPSDPPPAPVAEPTREELLARADELGLTIDGRWGDARIAAAIAEAEAAS